MRLHRIQRQRWFWIKYDLMVYALLNSVQSNVVDVFCAVLRSLGMFPFFLPFSVDSGNRALMLMCTVFCSKPNCWNKFECLQTMQWIKIYKVSLQVKLVYSFTLTSPTIVKLVASRCTSHFIKHKRRTVQSADCRHSSTTQHWGKHCLDILANQCFT